MKLFLTILLICIMLNIETSDSAELKIFPFKANIETLDNGLKVIIIPTPTNGIVAYYSVVRTGSRDEWEPGHSGFAHFFEHMMFRGTKKYPGHVYDSLVIAMGANANAYTTDDYTCYHLNITKDNLEKVIELESDRFQNLSYPEDAFKVESGAVYGEYRKGKTSPFEWVYEKISDLAFDKHTYKHTTIGFEEDIKAMPTMYDYSISFFKRYYRPENVVLVVVGDVETNNLMKMIKQYYSPWQKGYVEPKIEQEPPQTAERIAQINYPGKSLPILAIGYKGSAFNSKDKRTVAALMLGELAFGSTSKLYKKLYLNEQKVQAIEPEFNKNRDPFLWMIWAMIKDKKDVDYVRNEIYTVLEEFKKSPVDTKMLENLKKRMKYQFLMNLDTPDKVAGVLARYIALSGGMESVDEYFSTVQSISPSDIQEAANHFFVPEKRTVVTLFGSK